MKTTMDATGFEATATAEERALARALEACKLPAMPVGTIEGIERRVRARRMRVLRAMWMSAVAVAAAVALVAGAWRMRSPTVAEDAAFAEAEAEWLSPYDAEFEELETTLLAFEALDFGSDATAFPSL
ncbi:MAG: hypothetical protein IKO01_05185 [Kiritimatiellae bacterium]|nr:hypothetical protein [Kiritimatiellia bacterium]